MRCEFRFWFLSVMTAGLLTGCALPPQGDQSQPQQGISSTEQSAEALSDEELCACDPPGATNHFATSLQKLAVGDYDAARASLAQHAVSGTGQAQQEASAGLDLIDAIAAHNLQLDGAAATPEGARGSVLRLLLALIADLQGQIAKAEAENASLAAELEKREEALKRLRELTLGQPES